MTRARLLEDGEPTRAGPQRHFNVHPLAWGAGRHPDPLHVDRAQPSQQVQERRVADPLVEAVGRRRAAEMRE
jgi:hypothetical protein